MTGVTRNVLQILPTLRKAYERGENIMELLRQISSDKNDIGSILISYDLQSGSYTRAALQNQDFQRQYTGKILETISEYWTDGRIMEVGCGEATAMLPIVRELTDPTPTDILGFDISWSRVRYAKANLEKSNTLCRLFVADLFHIPLPENSVDLIYTIHSLEPNGGRESEALAELSRVSSDIIVLFEPDYDLADDAGRSRMSKHGYVRSLPQHAKEVGLEIVEHKPLGISANRLNPTGVTVLRKKKPTKSCKPLSFECPITRVKLEQFENVFASEFGGLLYPIIDGIPCLLESNSVLGTHFYDFNRR